MAVKTIISGGQSGVDRGALEAAVSGTTDYWGWCPLGGWAEDMPIPPGIRAHYPLLSETPDRDPAQRTQWNVRDSDAVLALFDKRGEHLSPGTNFALLCASEYRKPHLVVNVAHIESISHARKWLNDIALNLRLNIVGPRESEAPGICQASRRFILKLLSEP